MNKTEHLHPVGLLQPLGVPSAIWADISMDFIEGFPKINGKTDILTVMDRFSKATHFITLGHPYTATTVARAFFTEIVRLHGIPSSIVSDRNPTFTSNFWQELFKLSGVRLQMLSVFHPQSDGQTEVVNKIITMYLRCLTCDRPWQWLQWLPWAEFCYNLAYQSSLRTSPFRVVFGRDPPPPSILSYEPGMTLVPAVAQQLAERDEFLTEIRDRLEQAQQHYKSYYDKKHRDFQFSVHDWVWLRLLNRPVASLREIGTSLLWSLQDHRTGGRRRVQAGAPCWRQATQCFPRRPAEAISWHYAEWARPPALNTSWSCYLSTSRSHQRAPSARRA
jgi:hypothetical protein